MILRCFGFLILWLCLPVRSRAQTVDLHRVMSVPGPYLRFDPFTVNNEFFEQAAQKSLQLHDSRGYLWFISEQSNRQQLLRYDGTYDHVFGADSLRYAGKQSSSYDQRTGRVKEDADHRIWIATQRGLGRYDPLHETFQYWRNPYVRQQTVEHWILGLAGDQWFVTEETPDQRPMRSFFVFNARTNRVRKVCPARLINGYTRQPDSTRSLTFRPRAVDAAGRVWGDVFTGVSTLGYYDLARNQLVWYPVRRFQQQKSVADDEQLHFINDIICQGRYVWLGSWSRVGLLRFDMQTGHWKQYYFASHFHNRIQQMLPRGNHQFWLLTDTNPVIFDQLAETLFLYSTPTPNIVPVRNELRPYALGHHQDFWTGLSAGPGNATLKVLHEPQQYFTYTGDTLDSFTMLYKQGGRLYFTYYETHQNLVFAEYDQHTHRRTVLQRFPLKNFTEQNLYVALPDSLRQMAWLLGTTATGAVFRFDARTRQLQSVNALIHGLPVGESQLSDYGDAFRSVAQDRQGNVWMGAYKSAPGNLLKFEQATGQWTGFRAGTHGLPAGKIRTIMADRQGQLWLGYQDGGVCRFDPVHNRADQVLPAVPSGQPAVIGLVDDPARRTVWIARSQFGLWRYDRQNRTTRLFKPEAVWSNAERLNDGSSFNSTFYLTRQGYLWFKTLTALVRLNPDTGEILRLGTEYDLNDFVYSRFIKTADDEFFFEKFRFYDQSIQPDTGRPPVVFSFLNVFDRPLALPQSLNSSTTVTLRYDQNFFTVGFSALSYFEPERNQYAYQLVGFNANWVRVGNKPLATFTNVPPGRYTLRIRGSNAEGRWSNIRTLTLVIYPPYWQTGWFRVLMLSLLLALLYGLYRFQLERRTLGARLETEAARRRQKEAELQEQQAAFALKLSQTEMALLRAQMNPHFIFNCLNSIQYFTARHQIDQASDYLTKFSRLIRLVLEHANVEKVSLADELETLRLYIDMEAMRFTEKLHYQIRLADEIDADSVQIPPMLLQPFVENAVWHGLMHKDEGGTVQIHIELFTENVLQIEIIDDGIGRAKAAEYRSKSATKHKSFGITITAERIKLIDQLHHVHTQVDLYDLVDEQGQPRGTTVLIRIPI